MDVNAPRGLRAARMPMGLLAVAVLLCAACAARPTGARTVCAGGNCYDMGPLGPEWKAIAREDGFAGFYQPTSGGVILSNATCRDDAEAAPLSSLTAHLLVGYTARRERSSELVAMAGREALHSVIEARLDGVPVVLDLYVLKRNGCVFDLCFVAPPATYESGLADFRRFVEAFHPLPRPKA